jgi:hypothetical protein
MSPRPSGITESPLAIAKRANAGMDLPPGSPSNTYLNLGTMRTISNTKMPVATNTAAHGYNTAALPLIFGAFSMNSANRRNVVSSDPLSSPNFPCLQINGQSSSGASPPLRRMNSPLQSTFTTSVPGASRLGL